MKILLLLLLIAHSFVTQIYTYTYSLPSIAYTMTPGSGFKNNTTLACHNDTHDVIMAGDNHRLLYVSKASGVPVFTAAGPAFVFSSVAVCCISAISVMHVPLTNYFIFAYDADGVGLSRLDMPNPTSHVILDTYATVAIQTRYKSLRIFEDDLKLMVTGIFHVRDYSTATGKILSVASMQFSVVASSIAVKDKINFLLSFTSLNVEVEELATTRLENSGNIPDLNAQLILI